MFNMLIPRVISSFFIEFFINLGLCKKWHCPINNNIKRNGYEMFLVYLA